MFKPKKIYVVSTEETYGDGYHTYDEIRGVFSSRKKAVAAMEIRGNEEWNEIEERELDSLDGFSPDDDEPDEVYKKVYFAKVRIIGDRLADSGTEEIPLDQELGVTIHCSGWDTHGYNAHATSSVSVDHAIELAREARLKFIKDNEGKLDYDPDWHLKDRFS